jgi:hypothetical protein
MANFKYFAECGGQAVELARVYHDRIEATKRYGFIGTCPACGQKHVCTRKVEYKAAPSKHECNAKCMGAHGRSMICECKCGGKNHGRGFQVAA